MARRAGSSPSGQVAPLLLAFLTGFSPRGTVNPLDSHEQPLAQADREAIYARTDLELSVADFFKPNPQTTEAIDVYQALLLLQEVADSAAFPDADSFGAVTNTDGRPRIDRDHPTVYFSESTATVNGREHDQMSFIWLYSLDTSTSEESLAAQGLRLTYDSTGSPAIMEVLADETGLQLVFVSRHLEESARLELGPPLPGRRYSVEQSIEEAPGIVVAGVLEDSPEPMGPVVYLRAGSREVSTVLCRCMPSQARHIRQTLEYELVPMERLGELGVEAPVWSATLQRLRLPRDF